MRTGNMGKLLSLDARGKFGYAGAFGRLSFGYNRFGFYSWWCGIYQKRYYYGKPYISRARFYRPKNTYTIKRQNWRMILAYSLIVWRSFSDVQKKQLDKKAIGKHMTGYNYFNSDWLKNRRGGFGKILFSYSVFGFY